LIFVVPYGILADVYGRKIVAALCLIGLVLGDMWTAMVMINFQTFPTRVALVSSAFRILGGGQTVIMPLMLAIISDAVPAKMRYFMLVSFNNIQDANKDRTRAFFYISVLFPVTELTAPPLGSHLLETIGPHLTFLLLNPLCLLGLFVIWFMPETLKASESDDDQHQIASSEPFNMRKKIHSLVTHVSENVLPLLTRPLLFIAMLAIFVNRLPRPLLGLLLQFMSAKFRWKLAQVSRVKPESSQT
jgi:MFS family permease